MSNVVDNLIAYRLLVMLTTPFAETNAYKLGIIDEKGNILIKAKDLKTKEQKDAYTYLHRFIFNVKRLLNKTPGGESKLKNIVAAFFLIKESYGKRTDRVDSKFFYELVDLLDSGVILAEEQLIVEEFFLSEEAPVNSTGSAVSTDQPVVRKPKRFAKFKVNSNIKSARKVKSLLTQEQIDMIHEMKAQAPNLVIILDNGSEKVPVRL